MAGDMNILDEEKLRQALAIADALEEGEKNQEKILQKNLAADEISEKFEEDDISPYVVSYSMNLKRSKTYAHVLWRFLFAFFLIIFAIGCFFLIRYVIQDAENSNNMNELRNSTEQTYEYNEDIISGVGESQSVQLPMNFDEINETAEDVFAWIYVSGTNIDYPIVQHPEDDEFYLTHDIYGTANVDGAIFIQKVNSRKLTDFDTIIYGHNMKNGSMFRSLHNYEDEDFCRNNRYIYIYTPDNVFTYKVFAAYVYDDTYIPGCYNFLEDKGRQQYLDDIEAWACDGIYFDDVKLDTDSRIITLSTCTGDENERFLVQAVLIEALDAEYE